MNIASPVPLIPHLSASFELDPDGSFAFWQQDSIDEVCQSAEVILGSIQGQLSTSPNFGIVDPTFTQPQGHVLESIVRTWDSRFNNSATIIVNVGIDDQGQATIRANVALTSGAN